MPSWPNIKNINQNNLQSNKSDAVSENYNDFSELNKEIKKLNDMCDIKQMISKLKIINSQIQKCSTQSARLLVIMEVLNDGN